MKASEYFREKGVTRLCHFTKFRSLTNIIGSGELLATGNLAADVRNQNDPLRLDNMLDHVCCSAEYPNVWYWGKAKEWDADPVFREWAVIYVDLSVLDVRHAAYAPCNAGRKEKYIFEFESKGQTRYW